MSRHPPPRPGERCLHRLILIALAVAIVVLGAAAVPSAASPVPGSQVLCGPSCGDGGCAYTVTLLFADYSYVIDPDRYVYPAAVPGGCWYYARLNPVDNPAYGTQCKLFGGTFTIKAGGPHLYFDDTSPTINTETQQSDVNSCANYGANNYGSGRIRAEYMAPYPWTKITSSQGIDTFLAELYGSGAGDEQSYWPDWNPTDYRGTINAGAYVYNNGGSVDLSSSLFASLENRVYQLCEDTPAGGTLSVYDSYALANSNLGDPNTAEQAVIDGMNACVG